MSISSSAATNGGRPIAVDVVYVMSKPVLAFLAKLNARDYFTHREELRRDFPSGFVTRSYELQAGQFVPLHGLSPPCHVVDTLIYADYATGGQHRATIGRARAISLLLEQQEFAWTPR